MINKIGFTGTKIGFSNKQICLFKNLVNKYSFQEFHHGDCVGADKQAHDIIRNLYPNVKIICHLPINDNLRAFCICDKYKVPKSYLERNRAIVNHTDLLIAISGTVKEQLRSGTWATIRFARKSQKEIRIILPNGAIIK